MADRITAEERSRLMAKIRGKDTTPELIVRRLVHSLGYRYRLHVTSLSGSPDLAFPGRCKAIFVHGCFWHDHKCKVAGRPPQTRKEYWQAKFARNRQRDRKVRRELRKLGWQVLVVWECQTRNLRRLQARIVKFLDA